ncbi:MAG: GNAT family N-acetyltransferase [Spirochaetaceae bacterium]|nr:MAG: GNAT family N-acetyltransferase [Spirochaetaceae bacterium]
METHIRPLTSDDEPFLWEMLYRAIHVPDGNSPPPRAVLQLPELSRYVQGWGCRGDCGFLAAVGQPVGAVWLRFLVGTNKGYGYVAEDTPELSMAVLPSFRGQGIGTELLATLLASRCGNTAISLSVSAENPARRLYSRFGFEVVNESAGSLTMARGPVSWYN